MKNLVSQSIIKFSILFAVILLSLSSAYAAGVFDRTFGTNGRVTTSVGNAAQAKAIAIQPDGKIVAAGDFFRDLTKRDIAIIRYNADGSLDQSFGEGGKVFTVLSNADDLANAVALQPDGKIVVVGTTQASGSTSGDFLVVRYNSNGSLDTSFGTGGVVTINQGAYDVFNAVAVQPDGKIVAAGRTSDADRAVAARLNPNGIPDSSFGGGLVYFNFQNFKNNNFQTIGLLPGGRIVVGGLADNFPTTPVMFARFFAQFLVTYESNGAVAQNFGFEGVVGTSFTFIPYFPNPGKIELVVSPDGRITVTSQATLFRLFSDGSSDATFRGGFGGGNIAVRSDGRFVITGVGRNQEDFSRQGNESGLYTNGGRLIGYLGNFGGADIAAQADDKFVSVGSTGDGNFSVTRISAITSQGTRITNYDRSVMVYRPSNRTLYVLNDNGSNFEFTTATEATRVIPEFFGNNGPAPSPNLVYWQVPNIADSPAYFRRNFYYQGETIFQWGRSGDIPVGGDYDGDKRTDFTVYRPSQGTWYISPSSNTSQLQAVQWGLSGDKPVPADYDYDGITDIAIYRPSTGTWWIRRSSDNTYFAIKFGIDSDIPLTGDYDGDGRADFVVYRPSEGVWYELLTTDGFRAIKFGISTDIPVPGDYDGDGRHDLAVFRQGVWYLLESTEGFKAIQFGLADDVPVSVRYDK